MVFVSLIFMSAKTANRTCPKKLQREESRNGAEGRNRISYRTKVRSGERTLNSDRVWLHWNFGATPVLSRQLTRGKLHVRLSSHCSREKNEYRPGSRIIFFF